MDGIFAIELPELSLLALFSLAALLAGVDTLWNVILAIGRGEFSAHYVTQFLISHVAKAIAPISFLAVLGNGIPALEIPHIAVVYVLAEGGLAAYFVKVVVSLRDALATTRPVPNDNAPG